MHTARALAACADQSLSGCKDSVLVTSTMESQSGRRTQSLLGHRKVNLDAGISVALWNNYRNWN